MKCSKCYGNNVEKKDFVSFSYYYCHNCKIEVTPIQHLCDDVVHKLGLNNKKRYIYISDYPANVDSVNSYCLTNVDLSKTSVRVFFYHTFLFINGSANSYDGYYIDKDALSEQDIDQFIRIYSPDFIQFVDPSSQMLIYG